MRKLLLIAVILASTQLTFAASGKLHVKGNLAGLGDSIVVGTIYYGADGTGADIHKDTFAISNGTFDFTLDLKGVARLQVSDLAAARNHENKGFGIVAVPGEELIVSGDASTRYDMGGSKFYQQMHELDVAVEPSQSAIDKLIKDCQTRAGNGENTDSVQVYYESKAPQLLANLKNAVLGFAKLHPDYDASATLVEYMNGEDPQQVVDLLAPTVKEGPVKDYYMAFVNFYKAQKERAEAAVKAQASGVVAPDFTLNDINGKPLSLSSLRGKYVLLDFWGSWCVWCIKGIPQMKEYYNKYKDKFEILSIDCNDTETAWKDAVAKYELPWLHVYNIKGDNDVTKLYAIQGFPTKILVGTDGKIIKTIVGEDPAFYTFLDETFGK